MLCHPYLSLQFYDLLHDVNVRGFTIGATNVLYKQKKHLLDAIVEVCTMKHFIQCPIIRYIRVYVHVHLYITSVHEHPHIHIFI